MKLSKRQRAQVVELLRCAADVVSETRLPIARASDYLGLYSDDVIVDLAHAARMDVSDGWPDSDDVYRQGVLEAAARVEEGTWP
jgi:hypothetical protein